MQSQKLNNERCKNNINTDKKIRLLTAAVQDDQLVKHKQNAEIQIYKI